LKGIFIKQLFFNYLVKNKMAKKRLKDHKQRGMTRRRRNNKKKKK